MADQKREPKGTKTGGQFAADVNPESTLALAPEAPAKPRKGKQVYFTVFYDEVTRTWHEDPEYMREGQHIYDNARNNGNWEPIGEHEDLSREAWNGLKMRLLGADPKPSEFDAKIAKCETEIARLKNEFNANCDNGDGDSDLLLDLQAEIVGNYEKIARLQQMNLEAQRAEIAKLKSSRSGFDLEGSMAGRIRERIGPLYDDSQQYNEAVEKVRAVIGDWSPDYEAFDDAIGEEASDVMREKRDELVAIFGEFDW